jgi:septum formation protein
MSSRLILASASPRRRELLAGIGIDCVVRPANVDERPHDGESPAALVRRLAETKARGAVGGAGSEEVVILAADTAVVLDDDRVLGKPADRDEAKGMLRHLSGRSHRVLSGVYLLRRPDGRGAGITVATRVVFRDYGEETVRWYADSGESLDKAGAYGIQGRGVLLTERIEGSWSNVVGLPLEALPALFHAVQLELRSFIR